MESGWYGGTSLSSDLTPRHPIPAVAAVIARDKEILLVKRGTEPSKGKWSVPGGSIEWGETLADALKREIREETGLEIEIIKLIGITDLIVDSEPGYHYVLIDYLARPVGGNLSPGSDAVDVQWVYVDNLSDYELTPHLHECLREAGILGIGDP